MTGSNLIRASHEVRCLAVDNGEGRFVMLALLSGKNTDALLALTPDGARNLADDLHWAADEAEQTGALVTLPVTRMGSA